MSQDSMKVKTLIKLLKKFPEDYEVVVHESRGVYDTEVRAVDIHPRDEKEGNKIVTLTHS